MSERISKRLRRLDRFLCSLHVDDEAMILSELDGFLAGVAVCPDLILPSEWLPIVWGESEPEFDNERQASDILGTIMDHYNDILRLMHRDAYQPIYDIDTDDTFLWETWAAGFKQALTLRPEDWLAVRQDEDPEAARALFVLARLADLATHAANEIEPMEIDPVLRENAADLIPAYVQVLHRVRLARSPRGGVRGAARRPAAGAKVGRNDPCPCGSGKKYKKCCLNADKAG